MVINAEGRANQMQLFALIYEKRANATKIIIYDIATLKNKS